MLIITWGNGEYCYIKDRYAGVPLNKENKSWLKQTIWSRLQNLKIKKNLLLKYDASYMYSVSVHYSNVFIQNTVFTWY